MFGIKYLHQLYDNGTLKTFAQLRAEMGVPSSWEFHYTRLKHAAESQFGSEPLTLENATLEKSLMNPDHTKLISRYYTILIGAESKNPVKISDRWCKIIPELLEEHWEEVLVSFMPTVILERDKIIQLRYLHQSTIRPFSFTKWGEERHPHATNVLRRRDCLSIWNGSVIGSNLFCPRSLSLLWIPLIFQISVFRWWGFWVSSRTKV